MLKFIILVAMASAGTYALYKIWTIFNNNQIMSKDVSMDTDTKKSLWGSTILFVVAGLGLTYLLNPEKFAAKETQIKAFVKKIFARGN